MKNATVAKNQYSEKIGGMSLADWERTLTRDHEWSEKNVRKALDKVMTHGATDYCPRCHRLNYTDDLKPLCPICQLA